VNATRNVRADLLEKAMTLPQARDADFFGSNRRPSGAGAEHLRIINDTALRSRLIDAGVAEGLQSPKGPQKIPSIIRLYPNFDAPPKKAGPKTGRPARGDAPRAAYGLPTVEDLGVLLERIKRIETEVSHELQGQVNAEIDRLKREIGHLDGDEFERAFRNLERALAARKALATQVREEAFKRLDADTAFEQRKYLRLISRASKT
jgi:hypothetical protein